MNNEYVCGFIFSYDQSSVLLMLKRKPPFQDGKFNGIGGKIEEGETPERAMVREATEEIGLEIKRFDDVPWPRRIDLHWRRACRLSFIGGNVSFFFAFHDLPPIVANESETVHIFPVSALPSNVLPNLRWLIPMCLSLTRGETCGGFIVGEIT